MKIYVYRPACCPGFVDADSWISAWSTAVPLIQQNVIYITRLWSNNQFKEFLYDHKRIYRDFLDLNLDSQVILPGESYTSVQISRNRVKHISDNKQMTSIYAYVNILPQAKISDQRAINV